MDKDTKLDNFKSALNKHISQIQSTGSFATGGILESFTNPGVIVDSIGALRLPLSEEDARALAQKSRQAPFGKGTETLVDESVRKTWEIDAARIRFGNERWQNYLEQMVKNVARELGVPAGREVRAELHKMLLYEKGAMFKPHKEFV